MDGIVSARGPIPPGPFDVIVVGGGIHGVAATRQCALAGQRTLLLEQQDFGAGSTSRAPRTVGDVLSDLERGDFAAARESLRERDELLLQRGHLVRPIPAIVVLGPERRRSALEVRFGLWLRSKLKNSLEDSADEFQCAQLKRLLGSQPSCAVLPFDDALCEFPVRLVAEWLGEAVAAGAVARNYYRVIDLKKSGGKVCGVIARDLLSEQEQFFATKWVINATGPWIDCFCEEAGVLSARMIDTVRRSHLVLQRFRGMPEAAIYAEGIDSRALVLLPWNNQLLFGTTQVDEKNAIGQPRPTDSEVDYLQRSFQRLFPGAEMDVLGAFAGIAAVPVERRFGPLQVRDRSLVIENEGVRGLLSVIGGALTKASSAARECISKMGLAFAETRDHDFLPGNANGVATALRQWAHTVAGVAGIPESAAGAIAAWHGRHALCIARLAASDPLLRQPICPHSEHIVAEAVEAVRHEAAMVLSDILLRRVPVAMSECWSAECTKVAAHRIGSVLHWTERQILEQMAEFEAERASFLVKPQVRPDSLAA